MGRRQYQVSLKGVSPLLLHNDDLAWDETVTRWIKDPANKGLTARGDDRFPAWKWIGYLYDDGDEWVIPADNLMTVLREGGAKVSAGKGNATFKARTQSGLVVDQSAWPLTIDGKILPYAPIAALKGNLNFREHEEAARGLGFSLFVKRARILSAKHTRVRPRFDAWGCSGTITVFDESITEDILKLIFSNAGAYCGLGDWRPSSKTPGPYGRFVATVKEV